MVGWLLRWMNYLIDLAGWFGWGLKLVRIVEWKMVLLNLMV